MISDTKTVSNLISARKRRQAIVFRTTVKPEEADKVFVTVVAHSFFIWALN